jgi:hypothetical protein
MSPDARLARAALVALKAATIEALAVAADLEPDRTRSALEELRAAGQAALDDDGTWFVPEVGGGRP